MLSDNKQKFVSINPVDVFLWTFRRNENDVINLYDTLASLMQISTGSNMLNFGYWNENTSDPHQAQITLCKTIAEMAELKSSNDVLDVGSGFSEPATIWKSEFPHIKISCLNVNPQQLNFASKVIKGNDSASNHHFDSEQIDLVNSTATKLPFANKSMDRIIALESAQHFKPFSEFISESKRVLKEKGILVLAIPTLAKSAKSLEVFKLGILSFTWSSEHYDLENIKKTITDEGFSIISTDFIGSRYTNRLLTIISKKEKF
ncbi:class I SAM-dependent methyltransferase [Candidatus Nitrosotalea sp. TS]|uniref:class I SAM-dependent methyltransferase n=1 Tax=Candidatus Nitrosotalea sp. TS TaxID=2341020 RepID=UPI002A4E2D33|nr:methyltransferase domain-containing protein [Candidatus Nitrosotalea sp. TS]